MSGYDVMVKFFVEADGEDDAQFTIEDALYRSQTGGIGYEVVEAFLSDEQDDDEN